MTEQEAYDTLANTLTQVFGVSWDKGKSVEAIKSLYEQLSEEGRFGIDSYQVTEHEVAEPPITGVYLNRVYLNSEATVIVADIDNKKLPEEVQNFLNGNIVFRDQVLKEHMVGCCEFDAEDGYDDLSQSAKDVLGTIAEEAGYIGAAYIRLAKY